MSTKAELACVYSALILVDDDVAITVSKKIEKNIFAEMSAKVLWWMFESLVTSIAANRELFALPSIIASIECLHRIPKSIPDQHVNLFFVILLRGNY